MRIALPGLVLLPLLSFSQSPGDAFFGSSVLHEINIEFTQSNYWDSLLYYKSLGDQTNTDIYMKARVWIDGTPVDCVGVRLKGNASFSHPGQKKSIKVQFNEYLQGQEFDNLRSFHLNNSAYDPTMIREKLFLDMLDRRGLPAPRCTFARVYYNGGYVGLYKIVESIDKVFLQTHFSDNDGNLYKGDPNGTLQWQGSAQSEYMDDYELKTNETLNDWSGLVDLIDRINNSGSSFQQRVEERFNLPDYISSWAANNLFVNLDSYFHLAHNYYLYDDLPTGKFQWITWDVGIVFGVFPSWFTNPPAETNILHIPSPASSRPLSQHCYEDPDLTAIYYSELCNWLYTELTPENLFPKIDSLAGRIRQSVYDEPSANRMFTTQEFEGNLEYDGVSAFLLSSDVPGLKDFVLERRRSVVRQLCVKNYSCFLGQSYSDEAKNNLLVYPNPFVNEFSLRFGVPAEAHYANVLIADAMGKVIYRKDHAIATGQTELKISLPELRPGVYIVKMTGACGEIFRRLLSIE